MPRSNTTGPRKRGQGKPLGKRSGSRTRDDGSAPGGNRSKPPRKSGRDKFDRPGSGVGGRSRSGGTSRSDGPPRRSDGRNKNTSRRTEGRDEGDRPGNLGKPRRDESTFRGKEGPPRRSAGPPRRNDGAPRRNEDTPRREQGRPGKDSKPRYEGNRRNDGERRPAGSNQRSEKPESPRPLKKFDRGGVRRGGQTVRSTPDLPAPSANAPVRLNKFIANSGVCSRREADELITMGLISVNGKVITTLGYKVNPGDEVRHESKVLRAEKPVYILLNKPKGFLTTTADPEERSTVMNLIGGVVKERIYPVGRLDRNTTGLLVLTNDGDLAEKLMHPSHNVKKVYRVDLDRPLTKADATKIMDGVQLEEGRALVDDLGYASDDKKTIGLEIHIGWNRVVRRIFESLEYQVLKLDRTMYAGLTKKDLPRGEWRFLTREEIVLLKHFK